MPLGVVLQVIGDDFDVGMENVLDLQDLLNLEIQIFNGPFVIPHRYLYLIDQGSQTRGSRTTQKLMKYDFLNYNLLILSN